MKATLKEYSEEEYDNMLDHCFGDEWWCINVAWYKYPVSKVFYEVDPIAYNVGFSDWTWSMDDIRICENCGEEHEDEIEAEECCKEVLSTDK